MLERHFKKLVWNIDNGLPKPLPVMSYNKLRLNYKCKQRLLSWSEMYYCKDTDACKSYFKCKSTREI